MARQAPDNWAPRDFKTTFCEAFGCPPEVFEQTLLRRCLEPSLRPVASGVRLLSPNFFRDDLEYLARVGRTTDWLEFRTLARELRHDTALNHGLLRKGLQLRLSGSRLIGIYEEVIRRRRESFL